MLVIKYEKEERLNNILSFSFLLAKYFRRELSVIGFQFSDKTLNILPLTHACFGSRGEKDTKSHIFWDWHVW